MRKKEFNLKLPSLFTTLCCLLTGLIFSTASMAQITPANCTQGCTSNDVQIQRAYLSDQAGNILPGNFVCPQSGTASVYLTLELTTKTPRVGVTIFTRIKTFTPPSTIGSEVSGSPISQCFGIALNQPTNKVTFQQPFNWTCGTAIVMTDIFIGWGTGNSNFCTGSAFQCPATPSKCYSLPPGSFVAIETPVPQNGSATLCSDAAGGTTATFNLNNITVTSSSNVTVTWWENYTAPSTFSNQITTLSSYSSSSKTVYAKITSNSDASVFSVSTVTLTVNQTPSLTITNPAAVCSPNTVDLTVAAVTAGSTIPVNATLSYWTNADGTGAVSDPTAVGAGTYYIKATTSTTPACSDIESVTVTVNSTPANAGVSVTPPTCDNSNGTVTVTSPLDGGGVDYEYSNDGGTNWQEEVAFTIAANANYSITVRNKNGNCVSTGANTGTMGAQPATPDAPTVCIIQPSLCGPATGTVTVTDPLGIGYEYSIDNGASWQESNVFNDVAAGSVTGIKVKSPAGCISDAADCDASQCGAPQARSSNPQTVAINVPSESLTEQKTGIKAFPNPFSDKVKFVLTVAEGKNGSLDIYNMLGQKVKTVYQGYIAAGTRIFELSLPTQQISNLVYVLRIGDKQITGKILQINQ
jgi:hypothetical protein